MARRDILASQRLDEGFPHTGLFGPGGIGKSFFTTAMAEELNYYFGHIEGSTVSTKNELTCLLVDADQKARNSGKRLLFFVDECHRLGRLQEVLYYPLTEWYVITKNGQQRLAPFTLFAATTNPNMLLPSFITRLGNTWYLQPYTTSQIQRIIDTKFADWKIKIPSEVSWLISKRCLGIPRLANSLSVKVRNEVISHNRKEVSIDDCHRTFLIEDIDCVGLRRDHINYLTQLYYAGGVPKGLGAISGKIGLDPDVVEGNIEPVLLSLNLIDLTSRGRVLTSKGRVHLERTGVV